jgi:phage shock protein A
LLSTIQIPTPDPLSHWGNISSIVGVALSLLGLGVSVGGFILTLRSVAKSKQAAEDAKHAAEKAQSEILRSDTMIELASAMAAMEEIKRLQRQQAWPLLPDRYSALRNALTMIRATRPGLSEDHKAAIHGAIEQFRSIETKIDRAQAAGQTVGEMPSWNKVVSIQIEKLTEVLAFMRIKQDGR